MRGMRPAGIGTRSERLQSHEPLCKRRTRLRFTAWPSRRSTAVILRLPETRMRGIDLVDAPHQCQVLLALARWALLRVPACAVQPDEITLPANTGDAHAGLNQSALGAQVKPNCLDFFFSHSTST
jgi:hypothetical protein